MNDEIQNLNENIKMLVAATILSIATANGKTDPLSLKQTMDKVVTIKQKLDQTIQGN